MRFLALLLGAKKRSIHFMNAPLPVSYRKLRKLLLFGGLPLMLAAFSAAQAELSPAAVAAFDNYSAQLERRLVTQHQSTTSFLAGCPLSNSQSVARLKSGETILEHIPSGETLESSGALLHHWRGTAFVPGATPDDFVRLMHDFDHYPQYFAPQIERSRTLDRQGDPNPSDSLIHASMRIRQHHVITVVMDTDYTIQFSRLDPQHGYTISHSTRISEIASPDTSTEHALDARQEHGFLWRINTYWSYEQRDNGLYLQVEAISLTRSIPTGLGWAVRPYIDSIPRESLEFTLHSAANALRR